MSARGVVIVVCLVAGASLVGCQVQAPQTRLSVNQLVSQHNMNARLVKNLWARARIQLTLRGYPPLPSTDGKLLLSKTGDPAAAQNFVLIGYETLAMELFRVGSSAKEGVYYLWYSAGKEGKAWWGNHELSGAPDIHGLAIDPVQLLSVLSIMELPESFTELPAVVLSMSHFPGEEVAPGQRPAYVLTYLDHQPLSNRILSKREIYFTWSQMGPPRPFLINLFDDTGERVMTARLTNYRPIESPHPNENRAFIPTDIRITWVQRGSKLHITLRQMSTDKVDWDVDVCRFWDFLPENIPTSNIVQVDAHLKAGGNAW